MGHGWKETGRVERSLRKCPYGEGYIVTCVEIEESDYSLDDREGDRWEECACSVENCPHRKSRR